MTKILTAIIAIKEILNSIKAFWDFVLKTQKAIKKQKQLKTVKKVDELLEKDDPRSASREFNKL